jgi:hypothetical protein
MKLLPAAAYQAVWLPSLLGLAAASHHHGSQHHDELFARATHHYDTLAARADCTPYKIVSKDTCDGIAKKCGISTSDLYKYNGSPSGSNAFCSTLGIGDYLCCSAGTMPDMVGRRIFLPFGPFVSLRGGTDIVGKDPKPNPDGSCKYIQVDGGDTCSSIADSKCGGIKLEQLYKFNNLTEEKCRGIKAKQPICCSLGTKPVLTPQPNSDGSCAVYQVKKDDGCFDIADAHYLTLDGGSATDIINGFNKGKTWGWAGCEKLLRDQYICLSNGTAPMPVPIDNAICGPQVPGRSSPGLKPAPT